MELAERFWSKVDTAGECWLWTGDKSHLGYGRLLIDGRKAKAHRVAWFLEHGSWPGELCVCHKCDTPDCVRPDHLFLGTHTENMHDCTSKRRQRQGVQHYKAKLSPAKIELLHELRSKGLTQREVAKRLGVTQPQVCRAERGMSWKGNK